MGQPHTGHDAVFTETRQTRPTKKATFPRSKAEKSPSQQHVVSYNPKNADPFSQNRPFSAIFAQWVCTLAAAPPQVAASLPPIGGNCTTRGFDTPATRRQRASSSAKPPSPPTWRAPEGPEGLAAVPVGGGGAWPGFETTRRTRHQRPGTTGVEGAGGTGGPGCGARGRRRGMVRHIPARQMQPVWRAPDSLAAVPVGGGRARAGLEIDHSEPKARVWRSRGRAAAHRHIQRPGPPAPGTPAAPINTTTGTARTRPGIQKPTSGSDVGLWWS